MAEEYRCEKCARTFGSQEALAMHNKSKHPELYKEPKRKLIFKQKKKIRNWIIFILIFGLIVVGIYYLIKKDTDIDNSLNSEVPKSAIHWHPHLTIRINGKEETIPANIGIGRVHYPMHTHDTDGVIHMENNRPAKKTVTLGYFFEVWGKTFNKACIFDYCTNKGTLKMYINSKENFEFEDYFMHDKDEILIEYNSTKEEK